MREAARPAPADVARVVLVGFMGTGKTTVGRIVARRLGWKFVDMDRAIEATTGRSIPAIFRDDGEPAFRELERAEAEALLGRERCVVAAGGGAFTREATRERLRERAVTVWLRCDLETLLARIPQDGSRPLAGGRDIMRALLSEREAVYQLADLAVDATGSADDVAERVLALLRGRLRDEARAPR